MLNFPSLASLASSLLSTLLPLYQRHIQALERQADALEGMRRALDIHLDTDPLHLQQRVEDQAERDHDPAAAIAAEIEDPAAREDLAHLRYQLQTYYAQVHGRILEDDALDAAVDEWQQQQQGAAG